MADSSSSIVNTDQTNVGISRIENFSIQVTTIRLTKENYLQWSATITMGIAGRGRIAYVNGRKLGITVAGSAECLWRAAVQSDGGIEAGHKVGRKPWESAPWMVSVDDQGTTRMDPWRLAFLNALVDEVLGLVNVHPGKMKGYNAVVRLGPFIKKFFLMSREKRE
ncbi:hypothetical protein EJ110_NYTH16693 [Nymphaea thermarum]|nr:hypothetical protein EJ110_NYTH16693 [Nymphaea thermarum]